MSAIFKLNLNGVVGSVIVYVLSFSYKYFDLSTVNGPNAQNTANKSANFRGRLLTFLFIYNSLFI
jgi:hypothetical protein